MTTFQSKLHYLAVPYSHPALAMREHRFREANRASAFLIELGMFVFSPISHCHPIAEAGDLALHFEYWKTYNEYMLSLCCQLIVLQLPGWDISKGVEGEMRFAAKHGIPLMFLHPETYELMDGFYATI